jgi:hypothetical protein
MADLTITAADVRPAAQNPVPKMVQLGATVTAGQVIARLTNATTWILADANSATTTAELAGENGLLIALDSGVSGDWISAAPEGAEVAIGATLTVGQVYGLSTTPGGIAPVSDLVGYAADVHTRLLGQAKTTAILKLFTDAYFGIVRP